MQTQKNLYNVKINATDSVGEKQVTELFNEKFQQERSGYQTKYRVVDGAIYKADDLKIALQKINESKLTVDKSIFLANTVRGVYETIHSICRIIDQNKVDGLTKHSLPSHITKKATQPYFEYFDDNVMPLLEYIKVVMRDCQNDSTFDDCVRIVVILSLAIEDIQFIDSSRFSKDPKDRPFRYTLGNHYNFVIISKDEVEELEKQEIEEQPKKEEVELEMEVVKEDAGLNNNSTSQTENDTIKKFEENIRFLVVNINDLTKQKDLCDKAKNSVKVDLIDENDKDNPLVSILKKNIDEAVNKSVQKLKNIAKEGIDSINEHFAKLYADLDALKKEFEEKAKDFAD